MKNGVFVRMAVIKRALENQKGAMEHVNVDQKWTNLINDELIQYGSLYRRGKNKGNRRSWIHVYADEVINAQGISRCSRLY